MRLQFGILLIGALSGCDALSGKYEGRMTCYADELYRLEAELEFRRDGERNYVGNGLFRNLECQTVLGGTVGCDLLFDLTVRPKSLTGEQDLDINFLNCRYQATSQYDTGEAGDVHRSYDIPATDCRDQVEEITWDGKDKIEWQRWWTSDVVCAGDLEQR